MSRRSKERGNYQVNACFKENCTNRDVLCESCFRYSEYATNKYPSVEIKRRELRKNRYKK